MSNRKRHPAICAFCRIGFMARDDCLGKYCSHSCARRDKAIDILDRIDKTAGPDGCWPWTGSTFHFGHGNATINRKGVVVSRVVYERLVGPIPQGLFVLHTCDNPPCCNPKHLYAGTAKDNSDDMIRRGRAVRLKGEKSPWSILTDQQAREIWDRLKRGEKGARIAREYAVAPNVIYGIKLGKTYTNVTGGARLTRLP